MLSSDLGYLYHQYTLAAPLAFVGIGLHSGERATMRILPAGADQGIRIIRRDLPGEEGLFRLGWDKVASTVLCTTIGNAYGHEVATVEHVLSALHALGISNARIELEGPEIPIMDGSALPFVTSINNAGIRKLDAPRDVIVVQRPIRLQRSDSWVELLPDSAPRITVSIDFNAADIGTQSLSFCLSPTVYEREIAPARTFGFAEQLWQLRRQGLARGGSINNAVLLRGGRVANQEGLRFRDEFVRHKALDVVGDLALAGMPIIGHYRGHRPGHNLNIQMLKLLMQDKGAWSRTPFDDLGRMLAERVHDTHHGAKRRNADPIGHDSNGADSDHNRIPIAARILRLFNGDSR